MSKRIRPDDTILSMSDRSTTYGPYNIGLGGRLYIVLTPYATVKCSMYGPDAAFLSVSIFQTTMNNRRFLRRYFGKVFTERGAAAKANQFVRDILAKDFAR